MEAEATKIRTIKVMMSAKRKKMSSPGQGGDFREGEPDKEPPLKFGSERGEGGAGRLSACEHLDGGKGRDHAQQPERERADGERCSCWRIRGSGVARVQQVESQDEVQCLRGDELDGQEFEPVAERSGFGRGRLGWLSGHPSIILRSTLGHNGQREGKEARIGIHHEGHEAEADESSYDTKPDVIS